MVLALTLVDSIGNKTDCTGTGTGGTGTYTDSTGTWTDNSGSGIDIREDLPLKRMFNFGISRITEKSTNDDNEG